MTAKPQRNLSAILAWNVAAAFMLLGYFGWRGLRAREFEALATKLGYTGSQKTFPIAHFRERVPAGAAPYEVWSRVRGYAEVRYYLAPVVGTTDTLLVQRFGYPMRWSRLDVDVEYLGGTVRDIDVTGTQWDGMLEIARSEAYARLGWSPPKGN